MATPACFATRMRFSNRDLIDQKDPKGTYLGRGGGGE